VNGSSSTQNDNNNKPYLDFLLPLMKLDNKDIPNIISIFCGENEREIHISFAAQVCNLFAQLKANA
jgi:tripeptidyl-peptidase-1